MASTTFEKPLDNDVSAISTNLGSPSSASAVTGADAFSKINTLNSNLASKADASKFDFSSTLTKWSLFSDSGKRMLIVRGFYKTNTDNDSYIQAIFNSNDKKLTLVRKEGSGSETTLATWSGT